MIAKQMKQQEQSHKQEIKNIKAAAIQESADFIKRTCRDLTRYLSIQHQKILQQFIDYKKRTRDQLTYGDRRAKDCLDAELLIAQRFPVQEAWYAMERTSSLPLGKYDCLVPNMKEHRMIYSNMYPHKLREDTEMQMIIREAEQKTAEMN